MLLVGAVKQIFPFSSVPPHQSPNPPRLRLLQRQHPLQPRTHAGPFGVDDAVAHGVAFAAVGHDAFVAHDAFLGGADAQDGGAGAVVEFVGGELHAYAVHHFKGVAQQ